MCPRIALSVGNRGRAISNISAVSCKRERAQSKLYFYFINTKIFLLIFYAIMRCDEAEFDAKGLKMGVAQALVSLRNS
jgi:hypothetical protein